MLEWSCLSCDRAGVPTRSIYIELEASLEEDRMFCGLPESVASQMIRELIWDLQSRDVCSNPTLVKKPRRLVHPYSDYLMAAAITHEVLNPFLPHIKSRMANFRRALWVTTRGIWWRRLTLKSSSSFKDSVADHRSLAIPENIPHIDTITHLLEVLVRILTMLCRQKRFGSLAIRPELTYGWGAREYDTESDLKHVEEI